MYMGHYYMRRYLSACSCITSSMGKGQESSEAGCGKTLWFLQSYKWGEHCSFEGVHHCFLRSFVCYKNPIDILILHMLYIRHRELPESYLIQLFHNEYGISWQWSPSIPQHYMEMSKTEISIFSTENRCCTMVSTRTKGVYQANNSWEIIVMTFFIYTHNLLIS